jgi:hypothetical protein
MLQGNLKAVDLYYSVADGAGTIRRLWRQPASEEVWDEGTSHDGISVIGAFRVAYPETELRDWAEYPEAQRRETQQLIAEFWANRLGRESALRGYSFPVLEDQLAVLERHIPSEVRECYQIGSLLGLAAWECYLPETQSFRDGLPQAMLRLRDMGNGALAQIVGDDHPFKKLTFDEAELRDQWRAEQAGGKGVAPKAGKGRRGAEKQQTLGGGIVWPPLEPTWRQFLLRWCVERYQLLLSSKALEERFVLAPQGVKLVFCAPRKAIFLGHPVSLNRGATGVPILKAIWSRKGSEITSEEIAKESSVDQAETQKDYLYRLRNDLREVAGTLESSKQEEALVWIKLMVKSHFVEKTWRYWLRAKPTDIWFDFDDCAN